MMKEAAERTATSAGDGTTTSIVLTRALVRAGMHMIEDNAQKTDILRDLMSETD